MEQGEQGKSEREIKHNGKHEKVRLRNSCFWDSFVVVIRLHICLRSRNVILGEGAKIPMPSKAQLLAKSSQMGNIIFCNKIFYQIFLQQNVQIKFVQICAKAQHFTEIFLQKTNITNLTNTYLREMVMIYLVGQNQNDPIAFIGFTMPHIIFWHVTRRNKNSC